MSTSIAWKVRGGKLRAFFAPGLNLDESCRVSEAVRGLEGNRLRIRDALRAAAVMLKQTVRVTWPRGKS